MDNLHCYKCGCFSRLINERLGYCSTHKYFKIRTHKYREIVKNIFGIRFCITSTYGTGLDNYPPSKIILPKSNVLHKSIQGFFYINWIGRRITYIRSIIYSNCITYISVIICIRFIRKLTWNVKIRHVYTYISETL